jgi:hypothetical protein
MCSPYNDIRMSNENPSQYRKVFCFLETSHNRLESLKKADKLVIVLAFHTIIDTFEKPMAIIIRRMDALRVLRPDRNQPGATRFPGDH